MIDIKDLEKTLWSAADKMRSNMDAAEYKHVVLGLIFLKYISDAFNELHDALLEGKGEHEGANAEDADEYLAQNVFFVPETARWKFLQDKAKQPEIGKLIDEAMDAIERINPNLKGVLPKIYADPDLNKQRLGELIDLIGTIGFNQEGHEAKDLLGRVYEYFLGQFADAEGKSGGQFYTPASIVKLLVGMLEPYTGRVYDGCCGSGGMFVQSEKFVKEHQGNIKDLSIYGQESNPTTLRLAKMNLAIRGIDARIELGDTFLHDKHKDLKADYIMANPPFNISDWSGEQLRDDARWKYGLPPVGNANYAWLQHFISKLSNNGTAGIVLANGSMNSNSGGEGEIRKSMIEAGLVDCMVALPAQLFYNTMIPACLWFLRRGDSCTGDPCGRPDKNEILFIDARKLGTMVNRRNKELTDDDLALIEDTYHNWRAVQGSVRATLVVAHDNTYTDIAGFCKAATIDEVRQNNYVLMPGRYVGTEEEEIDLIPFEDKMKTLTDKLAEQFAQGEKLQQTIRKNLKGIGYEF
jgi:type I restriction enzyme M protein